MRIALFSFVAVVAEERVADSAPPPRPRGLADPAPHRRVTRREAEKT
jgi:hypothetical protein